MKQLALAVLLMGLAGAPAFAQFRRLPKGDAYSATYRTIQSKLATARISLDFADAPLVDVIAFIRSVVNVNILLDPQIFKAGRKELKVTLTVRDLRAESALNLLLSFHKLSKVYRNGVLLITTKARMDEKVHTVVYDIRDMMFSVRDFPGVKIDITQQGKGPGTTLLYEESKDNPTNELANPERLIEILKDNAAKSSWDASPKITIAIINGLLVVNQTRSGHYEVNRLLRMLRSFR